MVAASQPAKCTVPALEEAAKAGGCGGALFLVTARWRSVELTAVCNVVQYLEAEAAGVRGGKQVGRRERAVVPESGTGIR